MKDIFLTAINASIEAGKEILRIYNNDDFQVTFKDDKSPLTIADKKSNEIIMQAITKLSIPIISEENKQLTYTERKDWNTLWLVDPLDGTKEFIKRNGEFTVNIALIKDNLPIFGVIYVPVKKTLYFGSEINASCIINNVSEVFSTYNEALNSSKTLPTYNNSDSYKVVASKSHFNEETKNFIEKLKEKHEKIELVNAGSSLKLCLVAEGSADIYPRYAPTMEWDIAAGHAIAKFAGGSVTIADTNTEVNYNKENLLNPYFIVKR